ncbi:hypothetical protein [Duganella qianjiadongensis]|uniref:Uncharacterized protein n=1 Tax=Duganella qianjiadongensis TaxID=2692176 RepID=A0ABW9VJ73_9BURK|nr:hypothetical protein [Duganella qianjiadongensis]MYM39651.1 hypothetical protein [Duganella qianjiadongensis]
MQVNDQVQIARAADDDQESVGRAGVVVKVVGRDDDPNQVCHVNLDETTTHEAGEVEVLTANLTFLGR